MTARLRAMGQGVNPKRVRRLMRRMGMEAIYPKPRLSANGPGHKVYPYLLKGVTVDRPDQAWAADITYVRLAHGFVYLVAILDWYSRYVLSRELSTTLDTGFCLEALGYRTPHEIYFGTRVVLAPASEARFDMDPLEIGVSRASWRDVFSASTAKMAFWVQNG